MVIRFLDDEARGFFKNLALRPPSRSILYGEWPRIVEIVREHGLPALMQPLKDCFGVLIFDHPQHNGLEPELLLCVEQPSIPVPKHGVDTTVDHAEVVAAELTHTPKNKRVLKFYRLDSKLVEPRKCCY